MRRDLKSGTTLVIDRYAHSGVAFTAAKKVASVDWCKGPDRGLPCPDVIFYFHLSSEEALKRSGYGEERYEKKSFQEEVARVYEKLRDGSWFDVDASNSIDEIHKQLWDKTSSLLSTINNKEIGKLWT
ncbi:PREDICTED: thymidylate kinase-like [Amphimedon queenslandica]|uniref:dTMP kinase n=1 Tax=Amphimedon queenslandica TaxID=400682 RepID=A0A1X7TJM3_AMPQE|nr:PREDICTED: thymidylate kinase-like [Amphimedon queenslandica]|eukprot:XP_019859308.1 PREDICTED: thymidylate kinase-like [Amphimedon queenslandica]